MKKNIHRFWNKNWRKLAASFFTAIMIFQAMSGAMDVAAYEIGKVKLADTKGKFYGRNINDTNLSKNKGVSSDEKEILKKEPALNIANEKYDSSYEEKEKRTESSKTYKLPDGTYVQETFFEPVHKKEGKQFVDIDNTLENVAKTRSNPIYENKDGLYTFSIHDTKASIKNASEKELQITNDSANLSTYTTKENVILYSEAYNNIDMEYRLHGNSVSTNFYVNGFTTTEEIMFKINKGDLNVKDEVDALTFSNNKDEVVFSYTKPIMYDANNVAKAPGFSYKEQDEEIIVSLSLETEWTNAIDRVYPITMSTRTADESIKLSVESSYNRSLYPTTTSQYYDLFVGYENGMISGLGYPIGVTRTYIHIAPISIGNNKKIVEATLNLTKKLSYSNQWNTIEIGKTTGYVDPSSINWNNKPSVSPVSTTDIGSSEGIKSLDVTSYITDIYKGVNNTIELKATNESASYLPNVFLGESSATDRPSITIKYRDDFDVDPNLPIDIFDTEMRIFSILNKGFEAFSFDGVAKPDSQMLFELVEKGKDKVIKTETSKGNVNKYFIDPIYITNHIADTQSYPKDKVNYTTEYIYKDSILEFDKPYEYIVRTKIGSNISTKEFRTDAFIKYKVKAGDNLKNIASYYGIPIDAIKIDNNLATNTIKEDDILLLRFYKNNDKVSSDVYTPPVRTIEYKAKYVDRGANCVGGICPVIDPVNSTTGNYYYEGTDFTIKAAEEFNFTRYYNSTGPQFSNMFGNGFTTSIESYISYDKNGNMLYFAGDGRIYEFEKDGANFKAKQGDKIEVSKSGEVVVIKDLNESTTYQFDVYGYLDQIITKEGIITKINYDTYGLITSIKVGERTITLLYNDNKLVKEITLPSNKKVQYKYDDKRNLIEFIDANSNSKKYTYDKNNYLTSIIDKNNNTVTQNTYDGEGRVTKQIDGNGNTSTLTYGDHKTTIKKGDGSVEEYTFDSNYDTLAITQDGVITSAYTYDSYRNITSMTNEDGNVTKYTYDKTNLLKTEYPDGTYEEYRYDALGNVIYEKERDGKVTNKTYTGSDLTSTKDNQNNEIVYTYDDKRRVLTEVNQLGVSKSYSYTGNMIASITYDNGLIENFEYDSDGNTLKESDNQGKITTYVYNSNNQMTQKNYHDGTNEQWGYDGNGNIAKYKDRIGGITNNKYDKNNNLLSSTKGNLIVQSTYNEINQVVTETDEQGLTKSYTYDIYGRTSTETDVYGNTISYEYDGEGNVIKTIDTYGNEEIKEYQNSNVVKEISKEGLITTYKYDEMNREIEKKNPNGSIETKTYKNLLLINEVDAKGTSIDHEYDEYGREIKTTSTYSDGVVLTVENAYDKYGNVVVTKENGAITKNIYDVYGQLCTTIDALGNVSSKEYDFDGNVIKETDALGNSAITKYDGLQNVLSVTDKNGNTETKAYNTLGQLISETDALGCIKTYFYNEKGQVTESKDSYNRKTEYKYDEFGNMVEVIIEGKTIEKKEYDSYGREIYNETLESITSSKYDDFDRVIEKTNELTGLTTFMVFDQYGNTIEEKDSEGLSTTYEYDNDNRKIKAIDAYEREETYIYNVRDQIIKTNAFDGTITTSTFDAKGNVIESKDGLGKETINTYDVMGRLIEVKQGDKIIENVYDKNGKIIEVINHSNGTSTKKVYDKNGNTIETIDALGNSSKTGYDAKNQAISSTDANGNTSTKEYDAYGNVIKETNASGNTRQTKFNEVGLKEMDVDERGFVNTYEYNDDLLLVKVIDSRNYNTTLEYNDRKQKIKETNANGGVTEYEYDSYGREIKTTSPNGKVNVKEYDSLGSIIKEVDGKKTTIHEYDTLGRLTETKINNVVQVKNVYNEFNQIIKSYDANKNESIFKYNDDNKVIYSNEKGFVSTKEYDIDGNIIKQIDNKKLITENTYDANNNLLQVKVNGNVKTTKDYDANGNEIKVIDNGAEIRKKFDQENRLVQVEVPSANKSGEFIVYQSVVYDEAGNVLKKIDANGCFEEKKYDANNNTVEEINKNGFKTLYEFDGLNNVLKVQNHKDRYVNYTYDKANNVTSKNINNKYAEYTYDLEGNLVAEKNENGYTSKYSYDNFNRKTEQIKPDGNTIIYKYDNLGNKLSENKNIFTYDARGNVLTSTNEEGTIKNVYDAFNNKVETVDTNGKKVKNTFSDDNKLIQKEYAGIEIKYSYNEKGALEKVLKDDKLISKYEYNERNEITRKTQNDIITQKTYDDMGRIATQTVSKNNNVIANTAYTYDANDNIVKEIIDGKENTYVYDGYDELVESHKYINGKKVDTTYKQDLFGNQVSSSSNDGKKTYKYNEKGQVATIDTKEGIIKYSYNDNGNVSKKVNEDGRIDIYTYDDLDQLIKLEQGQFTYEYTYDAEKERIQQVITDTKDYHYDQWYNYSEPLDVVGNLEIEDTFKNLREQAKKKQHNQNVCTSVLSDSYDVTYFKEPEVIDYTVDRSMEYSEVLQAEDTIHVYGDTLLQTDEVNIVSGLNNSIIAKVDDTNIKKINYSDYGATNDITSGNGYNGEMLDESGLIYLRARYYDPSVSRFVQIDNNYSGEKEQVASQNKYVYTLSNPYKYVDKDGNKATTCPPVGVGTASGVASALNYLTMSDKDFKKWLAKKPIWERPTYITNRIVFQADMKKAQQNKPKPTTSGSGKNTAIGNSGGSSQNKIVKARIEVICPEKNRQKTNDRKVHTYFKFSYDLPTVNQNYGVFILKIGKSVLSKFYMTGHEASKFENAGFTLNNKFDLGFDISLDSVQTLLGNFGGSLSFGSWGSMNFSINTKCGDTSFAAKYTYQTINVFANDTVEVSATYKVNENISVKNYFSIGLNKYLAAVLIVGAVVAFPAIASSFATAGPLLAEYATGLATGEVIKNFA
ncbi:DUF6531 domain-containing protein [Amedibacillus sp. YH-ame10]